MPSAESASSPYLTALELQELDSLVQYLTEEEKSELDSLLQEPMQPWLPERFQVLWEPHRFKFLYGGRDSAKSWSISRALIWIAHTQTKRILCTREYQTSIKDSVHTLLKTQIEVLGLIKYFKVTEKSIISLKTGSEFIFKGLHLNNVEIKSTEGVDICWVEEAEAVSIDSLSYLLPTIRKSGSEVWFSWNPEDENAAIDNFGIKNTPAEGIVVKVSFRDNPYHSREMEMLRLYCLERDPDNYDWIWEGGYRKLSQARIFTRVFIEDFDTPADSRFFHGVDWGFANDPSVLVRCFFSEDMKRLYIDQEVFGHGVELDELPQLFDKITTARAWPLKADGSRPETISHVRRKGYDITAAEKWSGSVEDGITYLKGFDIYIHKTNCPRLQEESRLYSYKVDKKQIDPKTNQPTVLPIIVDAWNHGWDAVRYALDGYIKSPGVGENILAYYEQLAKERLTAETKPT